MSKGMKIVVFSSGAIALVVGYIAFSIYRHRRKYRHIPGRPMKGLSGLILGHSLEFIKDVSKNNMIPLKFVEDIEKYGPVVKYHLPNVTIVHTVDPEAIREILVEEDFGKNPLVYNILAFPIGQRVLGRGLVTDINHEHWRHRRALFNPGFHRQELLKFISIFNYKTDVLIEKLRKYVDSENPIRLFDQISNTTLDLIASVAFGLETDAINDPNNKLNSYILEALKGVSKLIINRSSATSYSERAFRKQFKNSVKTLRDFAREKILERIELLKNDEYTQNDILSMILKGADKETFDMEAMVDDFLTFFVAGQETTSTAISFFFLMVGKHPDILKKLQKEVDEVLGERSEVTFEDISKLHYIDAVWKETLRLYPPAPLFSRWSSKDITICGLLVPKNTWIICSPYSTGRCAKFYPNPTKFDPDRFFDENKKKENNINAYTFFPFSMGSRNCIGQNFASIEGKVIIAKLIQRFNFVLDETQSFDTTFAVTLRPLDGTRCFVKLRENL